MLPVPAEVGDGPRVSLEDGLADVLAALLPIEKLDLKSEAPA